jgi:hypothetical protein
MAMSIYWRLLFSASDRRAFDECLAGTLPLLGSGVEVCTCEPYRKSPELWECNLGLLVATESPAEQVLPCFLIRKNVHPVGTSPARRYRRRSRIASALRSTIVKAVLRARWSVWSGRRLTLGRVKVPNSDLQRTWPAYSGF